MPSQPIGTWSRNFKPGEIQASSKVTVKPKSATAKGKGALLAACLMKPKTIRNN